MANIHYKNAEVNAPWWWKRLESALVFLITGLIPLVGLTRTLTPEMTHDLTLIYFPGLIILVKSVGIFFGDSVIVHDVSGQTDDTKINQ